MADFCATCASRLGFPAHDIYAAPGKIVFEICEGCGPGWFDEHGRRIPEDDETKDGATTTEKPS